MTDPILRDIHPSLVERVQHLADARGCSLQDALTLLLDCGLARHNDIDGGLDDAEARVLEEAISALENVPGDPGFALIGRAAPVPLPVRDAPDQSIAVEWTPPR